jgi:Uma2 family endonuclease
MNVTYPKHRVTLNEWHKMGKYNIFEPQTRIELINGEMIDMAPIGPPHGGRVKRLNHLFSKQLGDSAIVSVQDPIQLNDDSEPEPDIAILRPEPNFYSERHPTPDDILLLIEVSDSTINYDRDKKLPLYAKNAIIEIWLVDLGAKVVEIYLDPQPQGYATKNIAEPGDILMPSQLPHVTITVSEILNLGKTL